MITPEQQIWLDHLSDTDTVKIIPFDPTCEEKYLLIKDKIQALLGVEQNIEHRGSSSLGISGQDEIDVYVPVPADRFEDTVDLVSTLFGKAKSHYPLKRARFVTFVEQKHLDIFVINRDDDGWKNCEIFDAYLLSHPQALDNYRRLKEESSGQSVREYYRKKIEFLNEIITKA